MGLVISTYQNWLGPNKIQLDPEVFTVWVEFRLFFWEKSRSYQDYYRTTFLTNAVSPINCESKLWWEKLTVKHLFGKPSFSANNNVWFIQFHKTKELQLFLPTGLAVYMEYFQGRGRGCGSLWRLSFCGSWWWIRLKAFVRWVQSIKNIYRCKWIEIRDRTQWVVYGITFNDLQTEGRVSSKLSDMLQSVEIALFMRIKRTHLLGASSSKHSQ